MEFVLTVAYLPAEFLIDHKLKIGFVVNYQYLF